MADEVDPRRLLELAPVTGAADDQTTHRVADEHELVDGHGPGRHDSSRSSASCPAVVGDVQAGVVADVHRRAAGLASEARPEVEGAVLTLLGRRGMPRLVGLAQPVDEHGEPRRRLREGGRDGVGGQGQVGVAVTYGHAERERVGRRGQSIAPQAVQRPQRGVPLGLRVERRSIVGRHRTGGDRRQEPRGGARA